MFPIFLFPSSPRLKTRHPTDLLLQNKTRKETKRKKRDSSYLSIFKKSNRKPTQAASRPSPKRSLHRRMDLGEMIDGRGWTEERHAAFLSSMEESFVLRMFKPNSKKVKGFLPSHQCCPATCPDLPLDRLIPDSATESTRDSRTRPSPPRRLVESGNVELVVVANTNRIKKRQLSQPDASHDQVVPQLGGDSGISKKKKRR